MAPSVACASARSLLPGLAAASVAAALLAAGWVQPAKGAGVSAAPVARHGAGFWIGTSSGNHHDRADFQYALIERGSQTTCSVSDEDRWHTIGTLQKEVESTGHELLWLVVGEREYVVRDRALVKRAHTIVQPLTELGRQQGELGAQQGALGSRQGELGAIQGRIGALQARFARLDVVADAGSRAERAELRKQLEELSSDARELGARQRELGERQRVLGERQRGLGERQRAASLKAVTELRSLADDAIEKGAAEERSD